MRQCNTIQQLRHKACVAGFIKTDLWLAASLLVMFMKIKLMKMRHLILEIPFFGKKNTNIVLINIRIIDGK